MGAYREPWEYWDDYCEAENEYEEHCPVCEMCGEKITDETYLDIDGRIMHRDCCMDEFEKWTEDYVSNEKERRYEQARER